jgi:hypothetical protein
MKNFMIGLILIGILGSCTYNSYTVRQEYNAYKSQRDKLIKICRNKEDSSCFFSQVNGVDHFLLVFPNEKEMLSSKEVTMDTASTFCLCSTELSIPSEFHVALDYERVADDFNCSTASWGEWYSTE